MNLHQAKIQMKAGRVKDMILFLGLNTLVVGRWSLDAVSISYPPRRSAGHSAGAPGYYGRKAPSIFPQDIAVYNQVHAGFLAEFFGLFADDSLLEP